MTTTSTSPRSSSSHVRSGRRARLHVRCSTRVDGDFHRIRVPFAELEGRRRALVDLPWTMLDQRHGSMVVRVDVPGAFDGEPGDVAITSLDDVVLGCWVGDCAAIVLVGRDSEFAVVHAGWRGLAAGVVDTAIASFSEPVVAAVLGPTIGPCCYEFGAVDLARVAVGVHADPGDVTASTSGGALALDVPAAVASACARHGLIVEPCGRCTGCTFDGFSHRARRDPERHVVAVWQTPERSTDGRSS